MRRYSRALAREYRVRNFFQRVSAADVADLVAGPVAGLPRVVSGVIPGGAAALVGQTGPMPAERILAQLGALRVGQLAFELAILLGIFEGCVALLEALPDPRDVRDGMSIVERFFVLGA